MKKILICLSLITSFCLNAMLPLEITLTEAAKVGCVLFRDVLCGADPKKALAGQGLSSTLDAAGVGINVLQRSSINVHNIPLPDAVRLTADALVKLKIGYLGLAAITGFFTGYQCGKFVGWACRMTPKNRKIMGWVTGIPLGLFTFACAAESLSGAR